MSSFLDIGSLSFFLGAFDFKLSLETPFNSSSPNWSTESSMITKLFRARGFSRSSAHSCSQKQTRVLRLASRNHCQQRLPVDLTEGITGNLIDDLQGLRKLIVCKPLSGKGENLVEIGAFCTMRQLHEPSHSLTEIGIRKTNHGDIADRRMGHQDTLDFNRGDFRTAANNQLFLAGNEPEIALCILSHEVAGIKPAVHRCILYLAWPSPIADSNMRTAYNQFPYLASRHRAVIVVNQTNLCAWHDPAYRAWLQTVSERPARLC